MVRTQNNTDVEELPVGGGKHSDQGIQNHPHVEELSAGGGKHSDQGTQNPSDVVPNP